VETGGSGACVWQGAVTWPALCVPAVPGPSCFHSVLTDRCSVWGQLFSKQEKRVAIAKGGTACSALNLRDLASAYNQLGQAERRSPTWLLLPTEMDKKHLVTDGNYFRWDGPEYRFHVLRAPLHAHHTPTSSTPLTCDTTSPPRMAPQRASSTIPKVVAFASRSFISPFTVVCGRRPTHKRTSLCLSPTGPQPRRGLGSSSCLWALQLPRRPVKTDALPQ
jgi:hypothetical protein